jgi:hypothetical protein
VCKKNPCRFLSAELIVKVQFMDVPQVHYQDSVIFHESYPNQNKFFMQHESNVPSGTAVQFE